jgi:hypothetical protein
MMRRKGYTLALAATLLLAALAQADEVRGVICKVDVDKKEILLEGRGRGVRGVILRFELDKDTRVVFGQAAGEPADLMPGKHVHVVFEMHGERAVALLIHAFGSPPARTVPARGDAITGTLQRVAVTDREIVVLGAGKDGPDTETTFAIAENTKITRGERTISLEELKEGESVAVTGEKRGSRWTATVVQAGGGARAASPAGPKGERLEKILAIVGKVLQIVGEMRRP